MKERLLNWLECPHCRGDLLLLNFQGDNHEIRGGSLNCRNCSNLYPIINYIPRFTPQSNYADGYGFQWNRFSELQLDKVNGTTISADRFYRQSGWLPEELHDKLVLEAGCGAGRFTQICLDAGAEVISFDYSNSVDACLRNHGLVQNLHLIQADIYNLPLRRAIFDYVFCYGVLQHTPSPEQAFLQLPRYLASIGKISIDIYRHGVWDYILPKNYLRIITTRIDYETIYKLCEKLVPQLLPISDTIGLIPFLGLYLRRFIPVANIRGYAPLSEKHIKEWAILDTFDMYAARYDYPATTSSVRKWFREAGLTEVKIFGRRGLVIGRGQKP